MSVATRALFLVAAPLCPGSNINHGKSGPVSDVLFQGTLVVLRMFC